MLKKTALKDRRSAARSSVEYQKRMYQNKIGIPICLVLLLICYPIEIYLRKIFGFNGYISAMLLAFAILCVGMGIGDYKANKKFGEK